MKTICTIFLMILSFCIVGQRSMNVTIIGTAHSFKEDYQSLQDFDRVQSFIKELNPDIICIESIPTYDSLSLKEILPNTMKRADQLRDTLPALECKTHNDQVFEGADYYAQYNFWNAYYQWFQVLEKGDSIGYFSNYYRDQSKSEFGLMVFPAAQNLGIQKLHGIDYRKGEKEFLANNQKVMKKLLFSFKWKPIRIYLKTQKQYKKAEKEGCMVEFINSNEFQDSFPQLIESLPERLPKSEEAKFVKNYWLNRNQIMADRIIKTATENNAQNILLTVGGAHVTHIKQFLEEVGHQVTTYGEILKTQNN